MPLRKALLDAIDTAAYPEGRDLADVTRHFQLIEHAWNAWKQRARARQQQVQKAQRCFQTWRQVCVQRKHLATALRAFQQRWVLRVYWTTWASCMGPASASTPATDGVALLHRRFTQWRHRCLLSRQAKLARLKHDRHLKSQCLRRWQQALLQMRDRRLLAVKAATMGRQRLVRLAFTALSLHVQQRRRKRRLARLARLFFLRRVWHQWFTCYQDKARAAVLLDSVGDEPTRRVVLYASFAAWRRSLSLCRRAETFHDDWVTRRLCFRTHHDPLRSLFLLWQHRATAQRALREAQCRARTGALLAELSHVQAHRARADAFRHQSLLKVIWLRWRLLTVRCQQRGYVYGERTRRKTLSAPPKPKVGQKQLTRVPWNASVAVTSPAIRVQQRLVGARLRLCPRD